MPGRVGEVTQDPTLVGLLAAGAVIVFLAISSMLLAVSFGDRDATSPNVDGRRATGARRAPQATRVTRSPLVTGSLRATSRRRMASGSAETAENFAATVAPSLHSVAEEVVEHARLRLGERVLDAGTGTGIAASAVFSSAHSVVGVDAAPAMLDVARRDVPGVHFVAADVASLPFPSGWFHVVISVHALQLASDPAAVLAEWRRVTNVGGRISLSVPGPRQALAMKIYDPIYRRHGMLRRVEVPTRRKLIAWARAAGWREVEIVADPTTVVRLSGPEAFARWMRSGPRSDVSRAMTPDRFAELEADLLAVTPIGPDGRLHIPFGTLYMTARNP